MKILFLSPHVKISGGVRIILKYADELSRMGHDVSVCVENPRTLRRFLASLLKSKPAWFPHFRGKIRRLRSFRSEDLPDADIIVAGNYKIALQLASSQRADTAYFYLAQHDEGLYHGTRREMDDALRSPLRKIVVSTWLQDILKDRYGEDSTILLNPIDREQFKKLPKDHSDETIHILMLHHTYEWKGTKEGVEIVQALKKKYPRVRLVLFGAREKDTKTECDEYYYDLPQERLASLYSNADIYLCPSWDEGSGLPSMEAMACGVALVTYDNGGSRDYALNGETALVAKRRDTQDLKKKLEQLIVDADLRKRIAENGYRHIMNMPTWEDQAKKLENIFQNTFAHKR